jgi:hypothetical protein
VVLTLSVSLCAKASSTAAWNAHDKRVAQRCLAASHLEDPSISSQPVLFSDRMGYTALLMTGRAAHSKPNRLALIDSNTRHELCLYQRKTRVAHVQEWLPPIE